jgi:hypothetical protein
MAFSHWPTYQSFSWRRCLRQVMVPQKPPLSLTVTWTLPYHPKDPGAPDTPFWRCLQDFLDGDDAVRANIFKLIPRRARVPDKVTDRGIICLLRHS